MDQTNFFEKLPESCRDKIRKEINIANNEEFISWATEVPKKVLSDQFEIDEDLIDEIFESEQYIRFKSKDHPYQFGFIPDSDE